MLYKEDWEKVRERMLAWWDGEILDRVVFQVTAPRKGTRQDHEWDPFYLARHYRDPERVLREWERYCGQTFFGGEYIPNLWVNLGPGTPAAYLGAGLRIGEDTVWFEPPGDVALADIDGRGLDRQNAWWKITSDYTALAANSGRGKFFAGMTDLNSVFDIICHLRGTQRLLYDLVDNPEAVKVATGSVNALWIECYDSLTDLIEPHQEGTSNWMSIWFKGRGCDVQCDFSAMLSPDMFSEFVLPHLAAECAHLDHSIYHLDGPGQLPHLDILLDIPELDGIQWIPGAGNPTVGSPKWFPLYERIQARGKKLVLQGMERSDVENVLANVSSKGLLIGINAGSENEAREWLKKAEKWTRG